VQHGPSVGSAPPRSLRSCHSERRWGLVCIRRCPGSRRRCVGAPSQRRHDRRDPSIKSSDSQRHVQGRRPNFSLISSPRECLSPRSSLRLALPILAGAPRNAPTPAKAGLDSTSVTGHRSGVPLRLRLRPFVAGGDGLAPRSRPPMAIRRPGTTIRQDRSRSQAHRSRHRRPCRAPAGTDSFLHSRPVALRSAPTPARRPFPLDPKGDAQTPLGCRCSLSLHRSRIRSVRSLSPVGCLIVAPAPAGGRRRERLRPSAPQGIARFAALHLARRC
jgi:hypothetical protein